MYAQSMSIDNRIKGAHTHAAHYIAQREIAHVFDEVRGCVAAEWDSE